MGETIHALHGLTRLAGWLGEQGARRVLVLCAPSRRWIPDVVAALAAFNPAVFDGARVHVPAEVLDEATRALTESEADALVAVGGGAAIGLGKALRAQQPVDRPAGSLRFAVVPTTYSGSEMTTMWGVTHGTDKRTGRDERARPDLVVYDPTFTASLPVGLTVQSLLNGVAHVASVLSTGSLAGADRDAALAAAGDVLRAAEDLLLSPTSLVARAAALRASSAAGAAFDRGKPGAQHGWAHLLGGATGLDHAALHAVLLPQFIAHLRERDPALVDELERATRRDLEPYLHDLLTRAGAPTALDTLGVDPAAARALAAGRPDLPASIVLDAIHGLRPTGRAGRLRFGDDTALLDGPPPERARRVVLALHGRGAEAGGIVRRYREILGHDPDTSVVGLRTDGNRWYGARYRDAGTGSDPEVTAAIARVNAALAALPAGKPRFLAGFSQGACLALEVAARGAGAGLAAVLAPAGGRLDVPESWAPASFPGLPVLLGAGARDPYVDAKQGAATAAWWRAAGAAVDEIDHAGERHDIMLRQRLRIRERVLGARAPAGSGFGNALASEALPGALPARQNNPRRAPYGLYAEQINGTGFTARRAENSRTWIYRIRPSSQRRAATPLEHPRFGAPFESRPPAINLCAWAPPAAPAAPADFVDGLVTLGGAGSAALRRGYAVHTYAADLDMERRALCNADGDVILLPATGTITVMTELGPLVVRPGQIALVPRGLLFSVALHEAPARGYVAEAYGRRFQLPERGPVGANGLSDPRHFHAPAAWYEDKLAPGTRVTTKLAGRLWDATQDHSPFDVVAWHGNHVPFVYDLQDFSPVGGVRFDHVDPSAHTVLSAPLDEQGSHTLDLVAFIPRWDPTSGTFRPPYFHRNVTTEINGVLLESPPPGSPFQPGACFITPSFTPHGVSGRTAERALADPDAPSPPGHSLWFQLESALPFVPTPWAEAAELPAWPATWGSVKKEFDPENR